MITPQPQPAAYWIALLDELTDGWFSEATNNLKRDFNTDAETLSYFIGDFFYWYESDLGNEYWDKLATEAEYIESGQSVIDAAMEFYNIRYVDEDDAKAMMKQVQLYKRCNGIKD